MDLKMNALKNVDIFTLLEESYLKEVANLASLKSFKKNKVIFHQGDPGNVLFVLLSGQVKIFIDHEDGRESILKVVCENEFFGEMSLLDGEFRSATISALEDSKALIISRDDFINIVKQYPAFTLNMLATLSRRIRNADNKIFSLTFLDAYGKVSQLLIDLIKNNGKRIDELIVIDSPLSRLEMAEMAGVSRETFARIINKYQAKGCLKLEGRNIVVFDEAFLKKKII